MARPYFIFWEWLSQCVACAVSRSVAGIAAWFPIARPSLHCIARAASPLSSPNAAYCCALLSRHCKFLFGFATVADISQARGRSLLHQAQKNGTFTSGNLTAFKWPVGLSGALPSTSIYADIAHHLSTPLCAQSWHSHQKNPVVWARQTDKPARNKQ